MFFILSAVAATPDGALDEPLGEGGRWIDLDRDGVLDLVLADGSPEPIVVTHSGLPYALPPALHEGAERAFVTDTVAPDPAVFLLVEEWTDADGERRVTLTEYDVDSRGTPRLMWTEDSDTGDLTYVGDMDGDGRSELFGRGDLVFVTLAWVRMSATGERAAAPFEMLERPLQTVTPVGDLDGDGLADVVLGFSTETGFFGSGEGDEYGHASLHLGTPTGLSPAVWLFEPSPVLSAGRAVVRIPGTDSLVFAVFLDREDRNGEQESTITVMDGASTEAFTIGQRFLEPDHDGTAPELYTLMDESGALSLVIANRRGAHWHAWDAGAHLFEETPTSSYTLPVCFGSWFGRAGGPLGLHSWESRWPHDDLPLFTWGWSPLDVGPVSVRCGDEPTAATTPTTTDTGAAPETPARRCGCDAAGAGPEGALWLAFALARRRARITARA